MMRRILALGLVCLVAALAVSGVSTVSASGDNNTWSHGEEGMYEENNNNPYPDDEFPGYAPQNRSGVVWP